MRKARSESLLHTSTAIRRWRARTALIKVHAISKVLLSTFGRSVRHVLKSNPLISARTPSFSGTRSADCRDGDIRQRDTPATSFVATFDVWENAKCSSQMRVPGAITSMPHIRRCTLCRSPGLRGKSARAGRINAAHLERPSNDITSRNLPPLSVHRSDGGNPCPLIPATPTPKLHRFEVAKMRGKVADLWPWIHCANSVCCRGCTTFSSTDPTPPGTTRGFGRERATSSTRCPIPFGLFCRALCPKTGHIPPRFAVPR